MQFTNRPEAVKREEGDEGTCIILQFRFLLPRFGNRPPKKELKALNPDLRTAGDSYKPYWVYPTMRTKYYTNFQMVHQESVTDSL